MSNKEMSNKEMWNKVFKKFTIVSLMIAIVLIACYIMNVNGFGNREIKSDRHTEQSFIAESSNDIKNSIDMQTSRD